MAKQQPRFYSTLIHLVLLILLCIPLLWNLLRPGFYASHDGEWMVIRLTAFHQALRDGQLPVRWLPRLNHGYGYPVTNFLYPLPFYLAEPIYLLTGNPATAVEAIMGVSVIIAALGMYLFLQSRGKWVAIAGALVYVYSPYVAYDLYVRGSLGELVALGIVPWIFWAIKTQRLSLAAIFLAGLITAHNVVALLLFPLVVIYLIYKSFLARHGYKAYVLCLLVAMGLSAFFWLPALAELRYVRASRFPVAEFENEYLTFSQAMKLTGPVAMLTHLGAPLFFITKASNWFWSILSPLKVIQFPWRLLGLFSFTNAVISVVVISKLFRRNAASLAFIVFITVISFISAAPFLTPQAFINYPPSYYETNDDTTTARAEYTPVWVIQLPTQQPETPLKHYYPGIKVFDRKQQVAIVDPSKTNGVIVTTGDSLPEELKAYWSETPLRTLANLVSLISVLVWLKYNTSRVV